MVYAQTDAPLGEAKLTVLNSAYVTSQCYFFIASIQQVSQFIFIHSPSLLHRFPSRALWCETGLSPPNAFACILSSEPYQKQATDTSENVREAGAILGNIINIKTSVMYCPFHISREIEAVCSPNCACYTGWRAMAYLATNATDTCYIGIAKRSFARQES